MLRKGSSTRGQDDASREWILARVLADVTKSGALGPQTQLRAVEAKRGATPLDFDFDRRQPKIWRFREFFYSRSGRGALLVVKPADVDGNSVRLDDAQVRQLDRIEQHYRARADEEVRWWALGSDGELDDDEEPEEPPELSEDDRAQRRLRRHAG